MCPSDEVGLPPSYLRPVVLLLLAEEPAHGYGLRDRLGPFGLVGSDAGRLYRTLRSMEAAGLLTSSWDESGVGPSRHVYRITGAGLDALDRASAEIESVIVMLQDIRKRCEALQE